MSVVVERRGGWKQDEEEGEVGRHFRGAMVPVVVVNQSKVVVLEKLPCGLIRTWSA